MNSIRKYIIWPGEIILLKCVQSDNHTEQQSQCFHRLPLCLQGINHKFMIGYIISNMPSEILT